MAVLWASAVLLPVCLRARDGSPRAGGKESAEDFQALMIRPRSVRMTKPQGRVRRTVRKLPWTLDGSMVVDRRCTIDHDTRSGWCLAKFPREPNRPALRPRWILPNSLLEAIEPLVDKDPRQVFRISGETTIYYDRVFLLLRKVTVDPASLPGAKPAEWRSDPSKGWPDPTTKPAAVATTRPALTATTRPWPRPTTRPTTRPTSRPTAMPTTRPAPGSAKAAPRKKGPSSADILKGLMQDRPGSPVIAPVARPAAVSAAGPEAAPTAGREIQPLAKGKLVVNRIIRVLATGDGDWKEARFEADNTLREPPIRLLPCRLFEWAEGFAGGTKKLRVSGVVTQYKRRRYLLLRKVLQVRDLNQF